MLQTARNCKIHFLNETHQKPSNLIIKRARHQQGIVCMFCPIVIRTNGCQYLAYVQVFSLLPLQAAFLLAGGAQVEYRIYAYRAGYAGSCNYDARPYIYTYIYTHNVLHAMLFFATPHHHSA